MALSIDMSVFKNADESKDKHLVNSQSNFQYEWKLHLA